MGFPEMVFRSGVSLFQTKCRFYVCLSSQLFFKPLLDVCVQNSLPKYAQFAIFRGCKSTDSNNKSNQIPTENLKRRRRVYSPEDDKLIVEQVRLNGDFRKTHVKIAKELGIKDPRTVEARYKNHLSGQTFVKGKFSPDEDKIIREHIDKFGKDDISLRALAEILNRGSTESLRDRHNRLISENEYATSNVKRAWKLEEEETLIRYILNLKKINDKHDINLIENVLPNEFSECTESLKRSKHSCYLHWMQVVVPALKTHFLGLPLNCDWKLKMMSYIIENKIKHEKELDVDVLVDKIAPGQTKFSLIVFEKGLREHFVNKIKTRSDLPLYLVVKNKLREQSQSNPCFNKNHKGEEKRLKRANDIIDIYLKAVEL